MRPALALLAAALLAGCIASDDDPVAPDCDVAGAPTLLPVPVPGDFLQATVAAPWDALVHAPDGFGEGWLVAGSDADAGEANVTKLPGDRLAILRVPGIFAQGQVWVGWASSPDPVCPSIDVDRAIEWGLERGPAFPPTAEPGKGIHVMTAGFLDDGTLFYTNIPAIDQASELQRPDWYAWEGAAPLPVYVYDEEPSEQPPHWKAPSSNLPGGTPAEPAFGAARGVLVGPESELGAGYFVTIRGFNDALKDLPLSTTRVVRMAPEDGYTRPGNEDHPLYGQALTFLVKGVAVVDAPCPSRVAAPAGCMVPLP